MKFIVFLGNIIFFLFGSIVFFKSSKIPKLFRLIFGSFFALVVIFTIVYYFYGLLTGTNKYILY